MRRRATAVAPGIVAVAAVIVIGSGCRDMDSKGGSRGLLEARPHARLAPNLGDFIYSIDSLAYIEPTPKRNRAFVRIYASTSQPVCAGITAFWQDEGESTFVQAYGQKYTAESGCARGTRTLDMPVYPVRGSYRDVMYVAAQPDGSELHIPLTLTDPNAPSDPMPPTPIEPRATDSSRDSTHLRRRRPAGPPAGPGAVHNP